MMCKVKKAIYNFKQSPQTRFDKFSYIISEVGFQKCYFNYSIFIRNTFFGIVIIVVYVDILLNGSDVTGIEKAKEYMKTQFVNKDMGIPRCYLGIKIAHSKYVVLSQRKL